MRAHPASDRAAESGAEAARELTSRKAMILRSRMRDLERPEERGNPTGGFPVEPLHQPVDQPGPVSVTAARGIEHGVGAGGRDRDLVAVRIADVAVRAA